MNTEPRIELQTHPEKYRHWSLDIEGRVAYLRMNVDETQGLRPGYTLKLNSYDLGVDIELHDAVQRLRFEHPEVGAVVLTSGKERVFCSGANIQMLGKSTHSHKVNFCKFTNETRNSIEEASAESGQRYLCAVNGTAAGGGYELALATDYIMLVDDNTSTVSLPEVPLLAVLPGTGGLTRVVDKRRVRRDHADVFCTVAEGIKGKRAVQWKLVDELVPRSRFDEVIRERAEEFATQSPRPAEAQGLTLTPLERNFEGNTIRYPHLTVELDRQRRMATFTVQGPTEPLPETLEEITAAGVEFWPLAMTRELDDAILHLTFNETDLGLWAFRTAGSVALVAKADRILLQNRQHWLINEILLFLRRTLKRIDLASRSLLAFIEPGSCFAGSLLELVLAADRSYMLDGSFESQDLPPATLQATAMNFGPLPMCNGLSRLETRFLGDADALDHVRERQGDALAAGAADELGLVTFIPDDLDWEDEVRIAVEERTSFSPDALTGMEASLRFPGPETLETKIFGRLSAWQNWIFQRPNAVGEEGALQLYGTGRRAKYNPQRV